jgi:hypothetical protein
MCRRLRRRSRTTPAGIARGAYDSDSRAGYSFFRRAELLNSVAIAALVLLVLQRSGAARRNPRAGRGSRCKLWPQIVPEEIASSAKNDDSLVFRVKFRERSFLLPGDAEKLPEHYMLSESDPAFLQSDVLKVGHHGSKNSTIRDFLAAVRPRLAVISSGEENPYAHPSPQLIERLHQGGVPTLRTDINGAVHIPTDGNNLEVSCFVACPEITAQINSTKPQTPQDQQCNQQQ